MDDNNDWAAGGLGCLAAGAIAAAAIVAGAVLEGWVLRHLWAWHLSPLVHIPAPSVASCIGLAALAGALQRAPSTSDSKDDKGGKALAALFLRPLLFLLIGWVALQFV